MFGWEDRLLNKFAGEGNVWASNHLRQRVWPVHAIDVGAALEVMLQDDTTASETYELHGPTNYSMHEIHDICCREVFKRRPVFNIPKFIRKPFTTALSKAVWFVVSNGDMVEREFIDQVNDPTAKTFKDLAIEPSELKACTFEYLQGFRSNVYYDLPAMTEKEKREEKKFMHVIDNQ